MPSEALEVPLNSPDAGAQTVKGPFESTLMPFKPAQSPAKMSTKAAAGTEESKEGSKQSSVVLSLQQSKQQSAVHQAHQQATSSGNSASLHAADHVAADVLNQTDVPGPATGPALKPPVTQAGPKAELPVAALKAKAAASTIPPAQQANLHAPSVAQAVPTADLVSKPMDSKTAFSSSPSVQRADLAVAPLSDLTDSKASSVASLEMSRQAIQQPSRSEAASSSVPVQANTASSESADMIAQMDVAQSPALLGKPADSRTAGQLSDKVSPAFGRQLAFPRARRPILSAVKASVLSLQPVTTKVSQHFLMP